MDISLKIAEELQIKKTQVDAAVGLIDLVAQLAAGDKRYLHAAEEGGKKQGYDEEDYLGCTHSVFILNSEL